MAVGATRGNVILLVLRSAFAQVTTGLALGLTLSFVAGRMLHANLYEVGELDLAALGAAMAILLLSALMASLIPAQRAASVGTDDYIARGLRHLCPRVLSPFHRAELDY
jgi:hypothetical protein